MPKRCLSISLMDCIPKAVEDAVLEEVLQSPVFGGQFRQNAGRALLMPRTTPGKRTPLWLQRLRAADLLQAVRQFEDFPIVIETVREVLNDVLDFPHFREMIGRIASGAMRVRSVQTEIPSPFAASLLFDFIAVYMYEWDQPRADRLSQYLAINRELLAEVVDLESLSSMIRPEAIRTVERRLQHVEENRRARTPEELMELLIRIGDLSGEEVLERCAGNGKAMVDALEADRRVVRVRLGSATRWVAGEDRQTYARLDEDREAECVLRRFVEHHGPITTAELADRYAIPEDRIRTLTAPLGGGPEYGARPLPASAFARHGRSAMVFPPEPGTHSPADHFHTPEGDSTLFTRRVHFFSPVPASSSLRLPAR